jgi:hypothetical protein
MTCSLISSDHRRRSCEGAPSRRSGTASIIWKLLVLELCADIEVHTWSLFWLRYLAHKTTASPDGISLPLTVKTLGHTVVSWQWCPWRPFYAFASARCVAWWGLGHSMVIYLARRFFRCVCCPRRWCIAGRNHAGTDFSSCVDDGTDWVRQSFHLSYVNHSGNSDPRSANNRVEINLRCSP